MQLWLLLPSSIEYRKCVECIEYHFFSNRSKWIGGDFQSAIEINLIDPGRKSSHAILRFNFETWLINVRGDHHQWLNRNSFYVLSLSMPPFVHDHRSPLYLSQTQPTYAHANETRLAWSNESEKKDKNFVGKENELSAINNDASCNKFHWQPWQRLICVAKSPPTFHTLRIETNRNETGKSNRSCET